MNNKQKLGYTILGAVIMLVGLAVGAVVSPPLIAQRNGVFDEIQCTGLTVVNENNKTMIRLESNPRENAVIVYNKAGKKALRLTAAILGNLVSVYNQTGEIAISLDSNFTGNFVRVYDPAEAKTAISLTSGEGTNTVKVHSKKRIYNQSPLDDSVYEVGDRAINLIASEQENRVIVFDQAANFKWEAP